MTAKAMSQLRNAGAGVTRPSREWKNLTAWRWTFTDAVYIAACMIVKKRRPGNPQVSLLSDNTLGFCWQLEYC